MKLQQQTLQLAALFDCLEDVQVWVKDREGRYRWVNQAFMINFDLDENRGRSSTGSREIIGKSDYDLSPSFLADLFRMDDEYVLTGRPIVNRVEQVGQPDGLTVWNVTDKIPLVDDVGSVVGTAGITRRLDASGHATVPGSEFGPVLAYIRDHYHGPIANRQLAKIAHMSVRAFERKFHHSFHLTPQKYLRKLRLRMASRSLVYTSKSLSDVACGCGFSDQSHFTRVFHEHFGRTPREYREHYRKKEGDAALVPKPDADEQEPSGGPPL